MADIPAVMRVEAQSFPLPWSTNAYYSELGNRSAYYIVSRYDNRIIGYAGMWVIMDEAHITTIAVDPAYRRQKVGERLLLAMIDACMIRGACRMTLEVRKTNMPAQNLYRKYGFYSAGLRKGYYTDNAEDAIIMWTEDLRNSASQKRLKENREALFNTIESQEEKQEAPVTPQSS